MRWHNLIDNDAQHLHSTQQLERSQSVLLRTSEPVPECHTRTAATPGQLLIRVHQPQCSSIDRSLNTGFHKTGRGKKKIKPFLGNKVRALGFVLFCSQWIKGLYKTAEHHCLQPAFCGCRVPYDHAESLGKDPFGSAQPQSRLIHRAWLNQDQW